MHMSDALISPVVGGTMWAVSAAAIAYAARKLEKEDILEDKKIPLMGVMGAFVFAAQMINFTIPATGSSGHISGALLLSAVLGPVAGFLTLAVVLAVQAFFFADGGLLALGCNIFNIGFATCFIAYPLIFKPLLKKSVSKGRLTAASVLTCAFGLQCGAFLVVAQTFFSGKTDLPFTAFLLLMQPIHLAIGIIEGIVTAVLLAFLYANAPEAAANLQPDRKTALPKKTVAAIAVLAIICGGVFSWFASSRPDGLEWSVAGIMDGAEPEASGGIYSVAENIQNTTAILPDYGFKASGDDSGTDTGEPAWPSVDAGTSAAGIAGSIATLALVSISGAALYLIRRKRAADRV